MSKFHPAVMAAALSCSILLAGCGNWNIKGGTSGATENGSGLIIDNDTGDKIRKEADEDGNIRDCTVGNSSERTGLPSCNEIVNRREKYSEQSAQISDDLLANKLSGSQVFVLPNGSKVRVKTAAKYNDEDSQGKRGGALIINARVEKINATTQVFENLFIDDGGKVQISFIDSDDFEMLSPLCLPLNIAEGQSLNVTYRKKFGKTTSDIMGVAMQARVPIESIREYKQLSRLDVAFRPSGGSRRSC